MTDFWIVVVVVGLATVLFKAAGPVLLGQRVLPPRVQSVVELLAPVMLTALVVTQTFGGDGQLSVDARVPGVAAAAVAVWQRIPLVGAMAIAAAVTTLVRAFS
jgi:branched-subunit amino acid transport protein